MAIKIKVNERMKDIIQKLSSMSKPAEKPQTAVRRRPAAPIPTPRAPTRQDAPQTPPAAPRPRGSGY